MPRGQDSASHLPASKVLLSKLAELMNEESLRYIANADRGDDFAENLLAVRDIRDTLNVPDELHWIPLEVLELVRWSQPEKWYAMPDVDYRWVYEIRAFCCAALLLAGEDSQSFESTVETLGNLTESLIRYQPALLQYLPDALGHWATFDLCTADHAFRLAAELCVWLELEDTAKITQCLRMLIDVEAEARGENPPRAKDFGKPPAFAGTKSLIQAQGWHCVGKLMADKALTVSDEETRYLVREVGRSLIALKIYKR